MSEEFSIKEAIKSEYLKCAQDPAYFMKKYCYIQHPTRGRILFALYPFQEKVLHLFKENQYTTVLKSRQLGISTLASGYSLWLMIFHKDKNILALATTQSTARNLVTKSQFMYENLPSWLKVKSQEYNKLSLRLTNGSRIQAKSSNSDSARSEAVSLLLIDEAAFIDNIDETFAAAQQTLATGGQCMALSTPNGVGNWFHKNWIKAVASENSFLPIRIPWTAHPERNQDWRDEQDSILGPRLAAQECDCDFLTSGNTVIEPELIQYYEETYMQDPMEKRGVDSNLWVWEIPDYSRSYMVVADVARGDGADYSACHVLDVETVTQVAEYKGKLSPKDFGNVLVGLASEYNDALLVVENASMGWSTIEQILEREYRNLYYSPKSENMTVESYMSKFENNQLVPGFIMSMKTRPLVVAKMTEYIRERLVVIKSKRLLEELRVFIWKNGRAEAQSGYNDDLIMSFCIALYIRDTALRLRQQGMDLVRAQLSSLSSINSRQPTVYSSTNLQSKNPYLIEGPNGTEDISWVL